MTAMVRKILIAVAVLTPIFVGARWFILTKMKPSVSNAFRAEFKEMPADDIALENWIAAQPGVIKVGCDRDESAIRIYWIMSQDLWLDPPPDIRLEFERFGYRGLLNYDGNWHDK